MVLFPSILLSLFAHTLVFCILLISLQFKPYNNSLNGYVIDMQLVEFSHKEYDQSKKIINKKLLKSPKINKKKVLLDKSEDSEINKTIYNFQTKKKNKSLKVKTISKEKNISVSEYKNIKAQSLDEKSIFQSTFSEQRMSKLSFNIGATNNKFRATRYTKSAYNNMKSCKYTKNVKSDKKSKNEKKEIAYKKQITISELLGTTYYNPRLININHLLKMHQNQNKYDTNITSLLAEKKQNKILCN